MTDRPSHNRWTAREVSRLLALIETERRYYQEIVSSLPVGVCAVTAGLEIVYANRAFRRILGRPAEEAEGDRLPAALGVADLRERVGRVIETGVSDSGTADKRPALSILPARGWDDSGSEALLVIGLGAAVPAAERPAAAIPDSIPALIWRRRGPGFEIEKIAGALETGEIAAEDRDRVSAFFAQASGGRAEIDYRAVTSGGRKVWLRDIATPAGGLTIQGVTIEITAAVARQSMEAQAAKLDPLARLSSRVAHDLNNVSTLIRGYGEELRAGLDSEDARRDLDGMIEASDRLTALAKQLHGYSRRPNFTPIAIDLAEALGAACEGRPNVTLKAAAGGAVLAERQYLLTALATLLGPQPAGPVSVTADECVFPGTAGDAAVKVTVDIPGAAFAPERMRAAFEPLATPGTEAAPNLATVEWVIRRMNGAFMAGAHPNGGTVYDIYLRRPAAEAAPVVKPQEVSAAAAARRARILVVEDEQGVRALLRKMLERQGHEVMDAGNGGAALELVRSLGSPVDLVLTDVRMPGMTGIEMVQELRKAEPGLRVLYVSGYSEDAPGLQEALSPITGFVPKPFEFDALLDKVRSMLALPAGA